MARRSKAALIIGVAVWTVCLSAAAASAEDHNYLVPTGRYDHHCSEGDVNSAVTCQTDNAGVSYYMDSGGTYELEEPDREAVWAAIADNYQSTDLNFAYDSTPVFSGSAETDIIYQEGTVPGSGYIGATWCNDAVGVLTYKCDQQYIRIEGAGTYTEGVVCHETGHAVGLVHGQYTTSGYGNQDATHMGCMVAADVPAGALLRPAQKTDINDVY